MISLNFLIEKLL